MPKERASAVATDKATAAKRLGQKRLINQRRSIRLIVHFSIACLLSYGLDRLLDRYIDSSGQNQNILTESIFGVATVYHSIVTAAPRKPTPRFTTLVRIAEATTPRGVNFQNACRQRLFLGEILKTLSALGPNVVVIDKYFGAVTCSGDDAGTRNLIAGINALCGAQSSVVVGRVVNERQAVDRSSKYLLTPALGFNPPCVREGVVNFDLDLRRVSLWWPNVESLPHTSGPPPSLALAAATAAAPRFLESGRLAGWNPRSDPPYVSFLEPGQFDSFNLSANDLVCRQTGDPDWRACQSDELADRVRKLIHSRVIVIGEDIPQMDKHETVVGEVSGYMLQANYIESLLDDRTIRPVNATLNVVSGLGIFALFEYILWRNHHRKLRAFLFVVALGVGAGALVYLSVALLGFYLNPVTIGLFAIMFRLSDLTFAPAPVNEKKETNK